MKTCGVCGTHYEGESVLCSRRCQRRLSNELIDRYGMDIIGQVDWSKTAILPENEAPVLDDAIFLASIGVSPL